MSSSRVVTQLCAVYGLRPEELRWLRIKDGANGSELWSHLSKNQWVASKAQKTEPRRLHPLLVCVMLDGSPLLIGSFRHDLQIGEDLPPLRT